MPRVRSRRGLAPRLLGGITLVALMVGGWAGLPATAKAQALTYRIDAAASQVRLLLFRKDISVLAHNHVLIATKFGGGVTIDTADPPRSKMTLRIPVAAIRVDPPDERKRLDFTGAINEEDRAEIRENMLSPRQLDGERFPEVVAVLESVEGRLPEPVLSLRLRIKQAEKTIRVPVKVSIGKDSVRVKGGFKLLQSDFGVEPYSILFGFIALQDEMEVRFDIVARP